MEHGVYTEADFLIGDSVGASDSFTNTSMCDTKAVEMVFERLVGGGGKIARRSLSEMINLYLSGGKLLVMDLIPFIDVLGTITSVNKFVPTIAGISFVLANFTCVVIKEHNGSIMYDTITNICTPLQQTKDYLTRLQCEQLGVITDSGVFGVGNQNPQFLIDYIVPKYDGVTIGAIRVSTSKLDITLLIWDNKFAFIDSFPHFVGEMLEKSIKVF